MTTISFHRAVRTMTPPKGLRASPRVLIYAARARLRLLGRESGVLLLRRPAIPAALPTLSKRPTCARLMSTCYTNWDGEDWQRHINTLLSLRYGVRYQTIPDKDQGDWGLEGFSDDGVAYQCYAAEEPLTVSDLTDKQRNKITRDIGKFCDNSHHLATILGQISQANRRGREERQRQQRRPPRLFDLMISDISMSQMDGWELLQKVRAAQPRVKAIALSGLGYPKDMEKSAAAGLSLYLTKPVDIETVRRAIVELFPKT